MIQVRFCSLGRSKSTPRQKLEMQPWSKISSRIGYGLAVLSVAAALSLTELLRAYFDPTPNSLFFCAIVVSGWMGGLGPGLLAGLLSVAAIDYYLMFPRHSLAVSPEDVPRLAVFLISAAAISWLSAEQKRAKESLRQARDELETKVHERTVELRRANEKLQAEIVERKEAEAALRSSETRLQEAQAELAHVTRVMTLGEMTASIAHEINQPLAAVVNNAAACLRWLAAPVPNLQEARHSLSVIVADGHRAAEIISRIRALVKKSPARKDWLDINEAILEVIALARSEVQRNSVVLQTHLSDGLPPVLGDRIQLQQVILNLVMNGIEAMSAVVDRSRDLLVCSCKYDSAKVLVEVKDSGVGLQPENLDQLFKTFFTTKAKGMGMGLAISRSIIEAHGGRLWATPNDDPGATFQFTLPTGGQPAP